MARPLPKTLDRRRTRLAAEFAATLDDQEREIIGTLTERRARLSVFGSVGGNSVVVSKIVRFTPKRREPRTEGFRRPELAQVVNRLYRAGWLRHGGGFDGKNGYFWLTPTAEWVMENA